MKNSIRIAVLTMGISSLIAQMMLLRELFIVYSGNELSMGVVFANWLILEAVGCFYLGKKVARAKNKTGVFAGITILFSLFLLIGIYLTRILRGLLGISIGETIGLLPIIYSSFLILMPVSVAHGALFPLSCEIYSMYFPKKAGSIGRVYIYETIGIVVGGILWTYLLIYYLHAFQMAVGLAILNTLVCLALVAPNWRSGKPQRIITVISCLFLASAGYLFFADGVDRLHHLSIKAQWKGYNTLHYQNSKYGNICVAENEGQYIFFLNGVPQIITPIPDIGFVEEFVNLPLLAHPAPKRVLIISSGAGGVINEVLKHPQVESVEYVELDPLLVEIMRTFSTPLTEKELTDPKVEVKHIDGRLYLRMTENKYDVILVGLLDPSNLQINRFFTEEFFSLAKKRLNKDGILVTGLPGSLTYPTDELKKLNACIFNTLKSVFSHVRAFPGSSLNLFLSSDSKEILLLDAGLVIERLNERGIVASVPIARHISEKLHPGWKDWFLRFLEEGEQKINRDFNPLGMFYSVSYWNALFSPYAQKFLRWGEMINLPLFILVFIIFVAALFLLRHNNIKPFGTGIPFSIATTGFAGMIFDLAIIFAFQALYGYVFLWVGLLVTAFMTGASLGAMSTTALIPRIRDLPGFFIKIDLAIILFSFGLPFIFLLLQPYLDSPGIFTFFRILFLILSCISGFLVGAEFPVASEIYLKNNPGLGKTARILYGSDLIGGWLGGVFGGIIILPIVGLLGSCVVIGLLKLSSFVTVVTNLDNLYPAGKR